MWTQNDTVFTNTDEDFAIKSVTVAPVNSKEMRVQFSFGIAYLANSTEEHLKKDSVLSALHTQVLASTLTVTLTSKKQMDLFHSLITELKNKEPSLKSIEDTLSETIINKWTPSATSRFWQAYHASRDKDPQYAANRYSKLN